MNYFKEGGPSYNWEHSKGESVSEFLGIDIKTLDNGGFKFLSNCVDPQSLGSHRYGAL